jgi:hypothetical protein
MKDKKIAAVDVLIEKAANAHDSADALRFSQAACNVANAIRTAQTADDEK